MLAANFVNATESQNAGMSTETSQLARISFGDMFLQPSGFGDSALESGFRPSHL